MNDEALAKTALRLACAAMPHLAGLAAAVRLHIDTRIPTAGITATGRLLVNPQWFRELTVRDRAFIMAHELFHLCLRSHERSEGSDAELFNWAHDYIINDMLKEQMQMPIPANGLALEGARHLSAEALMRMIRDGKVPGPRKQPRSDMAIALARAGLLMDGGAPKSSSGDVIGPQRERDLFPDTDPKQAEKLRRQIVNVAAKSVSLGILKESMEQLHDAGQSLDGGSIDESMPGLLRSFYRPPWEMALQQWMESVAPGPRTFAKLSRRIGDRTDVVLPGRKREGWAIHIILDTSGSMTECMSRILGTIATFCEAVHVEAIHVLQCDTSVTRDDWLSPDELADYVIRGGGGSDMSPAMQHLADDPQVEAAIVLTDGYINFLDEPPPYDVLWGVIDNTSFAPPYGTVMIIPAS